MSFSPFNTRWFGAGRDQSKGRPYITGTFDGERILVPLLNPTVPAITDQVKVASSLARVKGASLGIVNPVRAPEQTPSGLWEPLADWDDRGLLKWALDEAATSTRPEGSLLDTRRTADAVLQAVSTYEIDTLVLPGASSNGMFRRSLSERIGVQADCHVVVVNGRPGYDDVPSILLPIAGGPHSGLAADVARAIAEACDAWIDVLHVVDEAPSSDQEARAEELVDAGCHRIARPETTTTWILEAEDAAEAIVEQSHYYDLTVLGAPTTGTLRQLVYGSTNRRIRANAESVVLSTRNSRISESLVEK